MYHANVSFVFLKITHSEQIIYDVQLRRMGLATLVAEDSCCHMWSRNCLPFRGIWVYNL